MASTAAATHRDDGGGGGDDDDGQGPSYVDYEAFLSPDFSPAAFANALVLATNNPSDTPLDLSTPLSRVLFDIQEVDSHIDRLTARAAEPLLAHTAAQAAAAARIVAELEPPLRALNDSYRQLERDVVRRHAEADAVRRAAGRLWDTLRLGRAVARCLQLGRQLELQHAELSPSAAAASTTATTSSSSSSSSSPAAATSSRPSRDTHLLNHRALVRCADTILVLRDLFAQAADPDAEGFGLDRVAAVRTLRSAYVDPTARSVQDTAERIVREFSLGASHNNNPTTTATTTTTTPTLLTFSQAEEARARTVSALHALYLLSFSPAAAAATSSSSGTSPTLMLNALDLYLRAALQSSAAALARGLAALPSLDRALADTAARCRNVVALEAVLASTRPPPPSPPLLEKQQQQQQQPPPPESLLQPLLARLETGSLASYFWRSLAGALAPRVQEILSRGGASARALRANRAEIADAVRDCVVRGSQLPSGSALAAAAFQGGKKRAGPAGGDGTWEREVAVMLGSVVGSLGR